MVEDQLAPLLSSHTLKGEMKGSSGSFRVGGGLRGVAGKIAFLQFSHSLQSPLFSARGHGRVLGR